MIEYFRLPNAIILHSIFNMLNIRFNADKMLWFHNEKFTNKMMVKWMVCKIHHSTKRFKGDRVFFITSLLSLVKSIWIILQEFANRITKHLISWKTPRLLRNLS